MSSPNQKNTLDKQKPDGFKKPTVIPEKAETTLESASKNPAVVSGEADKPKESASTQSDAEKKLLISKQVFNN